MANLRETRLNIERDTRFMFEKRQTLYSEDDATVDIFLTTFLTIFGWVSFDLINQNPRSVGGGVVKF